MAEKCRNNLVKNSAEQEPVDWRLPFLVHVQIEKLGLTREICKCLLSCGIEKVSTLIDMNETDLLGMAKFRKEYLAKIKNVLMEHGLKFKQGS